MRPIDADKIEFFDDYYGFEIAYKVDIDNLPTLTPPEIVYCQDCVHLEDGCVNWCDKWKHTCPDDLEFFCKFGRKKDENTTD